MSDWKDEYMFSKTDNFYEKTKRIHQQKNRASVQLFAEKDLVYSFFF